MKLSFLFLAMFALLGCASKEKREIKERAADSPVKSHQALGGTIVETIRSSKSLTRDQKMELEQIFANNKRRAEELAAQSYQFRSVLIQELLSGNVNKKKIRILKGDIKKIEGERLKNTFETIEKISEIVSKHSDNQEFSQPLLNLERSFK